MYMYNNNFILYFLLDDLKMHSKLLYMHFNIL